LSTPLVSVLLPVRRWRQYTRAAVDSLLAQTLADIEVLIIGHDDVGELASRLPTDNRLRFLPRSAPGVVGATNTGLREAKGRWIARMDDDDIALPDRLEAQRSYLESNPDIGLCGARVQLIDAQGSPEGIQAGNRRYANWLDSLTSPVAIAEACFIENPLPNPTLFAHRQTWRELGGYREGDFPEDHELILRAWLKNIAMGKPDEVLLQWREHPERITWNDARYRREAFIKLKAAVACDSRSGFALGHSYSADHISDDGNGEDNNNGHISGIDDGTREGFHDGSKEGSLKQPRRPVWICGTGRNARYWHDAKPRQSKRHRPVITYEALWAQLQTPMKQSDPSNHEAPFIISAISEPKARDTLREQFESHGLRCYSDFAMG